MLAVPWELSVKAVRVAEELLQGHSVLGLQAVWLVLFLAVVCLVMPDSVADPPPVELVAAAGTHAAAAAVLLSLCPDAA